MADQPWHELPPEIARVLRPLLARRRRRDHRGGARRSRPTRRRSRGSSARASARASQEALRHFLAEIEAGGPVAARGRVQGARPRRDARGAQPRVAAQRLPGRRARRLAAVRRGRRRGRASSPTRCTCSPSRSSPTSTCSRPSRPRATRSSSRRPRARPSCAAAGWCGCWSASPPLDTGADRGRRERGRLAAAADASRWWRSPGERRELAALAPAAGHDRRGDRRARRCAIVPDPDGPGRRAAIERAIARRRRARRARHDGRLARARRQLRAARGRRSSWRDGRPALIVARDRAGELLLRSDPRLAVEFAADRLAPLAAAAGGLPRAPDRDAARVARRAGPARSGRRAAGHPSADRPLPARRGCASCSGRARRSRRSASGSSWRSARGRRDGQLLRRRPGARAQARARARAPSAPRVRARRRRARRARRR